MELNKHDFRIKASDVPGGFIESIGEFCPGRLGAYQKEKFGRIYWCINQWPDDEKIAARRAKQRIDTRIGRVGVEANYHNGEADLLNYEVSAEEVIAAIDKDDSITPRGIWMVLMAILNERVNECAESGDVEGTIGSVMPLVHETEAALIKHGYMRSKESK